MGRGVLRPDLAASVLRLDRHKPADAFAPFVDFYWIVRWDLRGQPPHEQTVLPHPNVHLVFEASGAGIFGVDRRLFTRSLSGLGLAFGVRFTAGGFRPFWQAPISQLTDRVVPAARLFGPRAEKTRQAIMDDFDFGGFDVDDGVMIGYAEALLLSVLPERDPLAGQAAALVSRITDDPGLRRVDQLAASSGLTVRTLQRLFADYVGVSPKWVMRRARLHDAAERADSGEPVDWAALASDLGYADQAHLTRDFTVTIGVPPARYAAAPLPIARRDRLQLEQRAILGAVEGGLDVVSDLGGLGADLPGREAEHDDLVPGHPPAAGQRLRVILGRGVPFPRVHLDRDAELRPPGVGPGDEGSESSYSDGLNSGMGSPDRASRSLRSPSAADLIPSATSASASRNSTDPLVGPGSSSVVRVLWCICLVARRPPPPPARPAGWSWCGRHRRRRAPASRTAPGRPPRSAGHPGRAVQPDELCVATLPCGAGPGHRRTRSARSGCGGCAAPPGR